LPGTDLISPKTPGADQIVVFHQVDGHQGVQPLHNVRRECLDDAPGQRLLGLMQRRPYDPIHSLRRWRLDPLAAAPHQQFLADLVDAPFGFAHVHRQPPGQGVRVLHRTLPETQVGTDL
jgi:hypothetical protein